MTGVRATSPTCLYLCPDTVSVKDETPMMLYLKDEESRGADEDAIDVGDLVITIDREVVVSGMFITQSQRTKAVPKNILAPHPAPIGNVHSVALGYNKTGTHQRNRAQHDREHGARDSAGDQKGGSETDRAEADRKILPGVSL